LNVKPEDAIRYADCPMPAIGQATPLAPGVQWVRMPLPFALDHINLWLLDDEIDGQPGFTVIDTGVATDATREAWRSVIANCFNGRPLLRVLCTHFHPDHVGLAAWLCKGLESQQWNAPLWMNFAEYSAAKIWNASGARQNAEPQEHNASQDAASLSAHFFRHGITDPQTLEKLKARREYYPSLVPEVPASFRRIFPNESIRIGKQHWHVIAGYGHSPEHCALYCEGLNLLISGDMVLPKISTNMSVWAQEPDANPLKLYLDSLHAYETLPDDVMVLPSHGKPFGAAQGTRAGGIKTRIEQLREHHKARLDETLQACTTPQYASQVLPVLFKRELDLHQLTFALGETIAHLNYLWHAGSLKRTADSQGRLMFQAI
jgi:glyoxylase-like metal-dependent hydrolase (beta-lactamase superfamily II)